MSCVCNCVRVRLVLFVVVALVAGCSPCFVCGPNEVCQVRTQDTSATETCTRPSQRGQPCVEASDNGFELDTPCATGLLCVGDLAGDTSSESMCVPPDHRREGEPCANDTECDAGLGCSQDPGNAINSAKLCEPNQ